MNVFAKFDEIPSMILEVIKETKCYGHTVGWSVGQHENSIPSHKHSLRGGGGGGGGGGINMYIYKSHGIIKNYKGKLL